MQAADGPNSSQLEWHQDGVKTNGPNSSQLEWHQDGVKANGPNSSQLEWHQDGVKATGTGDLNGDGSVAGDDLAQLLSAWGPCGG